MEKFGQNLQNVTELETVDNDMGVSTSDFNSPPTLAPNSVNFVNSV